MEIGKTKDVTRKRTNDVNGEGKKVLQGLNKKREGGREDSEKNSPQIHLEHRR